jgi:polar amino acid transport system ATP-binding protein
MIKLEKVNKYYKDLHVLKDITLEFHKGEIAVIIGPSGSGKSTLLYCINRIETIDSGKILIHGEDIYKPGIDLSRIRTEVGLVFQNYSLFSHLTVLENITLAPITVRKIPKDNAEEMAYDLLGKVGLKDKVYSYPAQLSGGQQQRIAIIRSLAMEPDTLLLDEPTNSLDVNMLKEILDIIKELSSSRGMTLLITTHELNFAGEVADRMIFMYDGSIIEDSTPKEVLFNPKNELTKNFLNQRLDGKFF